MWTNENLKTVVDALEEMIPFEGTVVNPVKNKKLDQLRKAMNVVHDIFNNGLCNRKPLFKKIFGFAPNTRYASSVSWKQWEERVEEIFTPIMIAAAKEQGVV